MLRSMILLIAFLALIGSSLFLYREVSHEAPTPDWPALRVSGQQWNSRQFKVIGETSGDHYEFITGIEVKNDCSAATRIAVHYVDPNNCIFLELCGKYMALKSVYGGVEKVLSSVKLKNKLASGPEHVLAMRRRGSLLVAILNGAIRCSAFVEGSSGGNAAIGVRGKGFRFIRPLVYDLEPVLFTDSFMRSENAASPWQKVSGQWLVEGRKNPSMSANAFRFTGSGQPGIAVTGQETWDNYSFMASFRGNDDGGIGLIFAHQDDENYWLFRWSPREEALTTSDGLAELVRVFKGEETVLARNDIGYIPLQWYGAEIRVGFGWAEIYVDKQLILESRHNQLAGGKVGLWTNSKGKVLFDDVSISEATFFKDNFIGEDSTWRSWEKYGGQWSVKSGEQGGISFQADDSGALAVFGSESWGNYTLRGALNCKQGRSGMIFHFLDAANYWVFRTDREKSITEIVSVVKGLEHVVASRKEKISPGRHTMEVKLDRGFVRARVDGGDPLVAWQSSENPHAAALLRRGRCGLALWSGQAVVGGVAVQLTADVEPLPVINPLHATDREMGNWSSWRGDWVSGGNSRNSKDMLRWHRGRFAGDVGLQVELSKDLISDGQLALSICKDGKAPGNGYTLELISPVPADLMVNKNKVDARATAISADVNPGDAKKNPGMEAKRVLVLRRNKEIVASNLLPDDFGRVWTVTVRKAGPCIVGYLNSRQVLLFMDSAPLAGPKVAWKGRNIKVENDGCRVFSHSVLNYPFSRAPAEWRQGAGIWEVTNRWQCDPRWSFFSGKSLSHQEKIMSSEETALPESIKFGSVLWNKHLFDDRVVVEFFAGIKMLRRRGGGYGYARDINCCIGGDGKDVSSGYNFMFGAMDNKKSLITRKGEIVASSKGKLEVIPRTSRIHHRWFYIRAERDGGQLRFMVDDGKVLNLKYTDPTPLSGGRVAIWTWDCGIIFSRVRISGGGSRGYEPIDFLPGTVPITKYPEENTKK
jgi:hypothetical protein